MQGRLEVANDAEAVIDLSVQPNDSLEKYTSKSYSPDKDELVSIIIYPWLYHHNGYLWDIIYPEISWTLQV